MIQGRFKKLKPKEDAIMKDYLDNEMNMSEIAKKFDVHYSNLRRFIKHQIKERGLEESFNVEYLNVEDFRYLDIGDTFAFADWLTIWRVTKIVEKENDRVFELVPSQTRNDKRHWVCGINTPDDYEA